MNIKAFSLAVGVCVSPVVYSNQSSENPGMTEALIMLSVLVGIVVVAGVVVSIIAPRKNTTSKSDSVKK